MHLPFTDRESSDKAIVQGCTESHDKDKVGIHLRWFQLDASDAHRRKNSQKSALLATHKDFLVFNHLNHYPEFTPISFLKGSLKGMEMTMN